MEHKALWYQFGFWLFSQPADKVNNGFNSLTVNRLKTHDDNQNGILELKEFQALMKDAFPNNPLSNVSLCDVDQETRDFFSSLHGQSINTIKRNIDHDAKLSIPHNQKIAELAMSQYLLRAKEAFPNGFDPQTPECELTSERAVPNHTQYATGTGSSERHKYQVATLR